MPRSRIGATNGWNVFTMPITFDVEDLAEGLDVLFELGERAVRDAGVGDDDVGHAVARDEIAPPRAFTCARSRTSHA